VTPFTHLDGDGRLRMVDVSDKAPTHRLAEARCVIRTSVDVAAIPAREGLDAVFAARLCAIQAAKRTSQLIPLCHPIALNDVQVEIAPVEGGALVRASASTISRTGVEMEALAACAFAALSVLEALGPLDPTARFDELVLWHKSGGRSGDWGRLHSLDDEGVSTD